MTGQQTINQSCSCGWKQQLHDHFRCLSVQVSNNISNVAKKEETTTQICGNCTRMISRKSTITRCPPLLVIQIMRYQNGTKSHFNQRYPSEINIGEKHLLLRFVIHQHGDTLNSGHYTCAADRNGWKMYNDAKTRKINIPTYPSKSAYLLLYEVDEEGDPT